MRRLFLTGIAVAALTVTAQNAAAAAMMDDGHGSAPYRAVIHAYLAGLKPKVTGGLQASVLDYPWQVSLGVLKIADTYQGHFCGGTIVDAQWIMTAAHCVRGNQPEDILIVSGTDTLGNGGVPATVDDILVNKDYRPATHDNDIALLKLSRPLAFDARTRPIALLAPAADALLADRDAVTVTGWGATMLGGKQVDQLRYADMLYVSRPTCRSDLNYMAQAGQEQITDNMLCAGTPAPGGAVGKDACQGDSGGPLSRGKGQSAALVGIVSWGYRCGVTYGVYTRVANYRSWLNACIANEKTCNK